MFHLKNKIISKIAVFAVITMVILWLLPVGLVSAEGTDGAITESTVDTTPPKITLNGDMTVTIEVGSTYVDAGAIATDDVDGGLTASVTAVNNVNTAVVGSYAVTYNVSDKAGNAAAEVTRIVNVVEAAKSLVFLTNPTLSTDKTDYSPEETVIISGTGFLPNTVYTIVVTRPDGSVVIGNGSFVPGSDSILTDAVGAFTYNYILDGILGVYTVNAVDRSGAVVATTTFTDCDLYINVTKYWEKNGTPGKQGDEPVITETATFALFKLGDPNPKTTASTNASGVAQFHITSTHWGQGRYKIVETVAPAGYTGGYDSGWFDVNASNDIGTWNWNAPNTELGSIEIFKTDQVTGGSLEGSTFQLWKLPLGTLIDTVVLGPGSGGHHKWENLEWGHYQVVETIAPTGYLLVPPVDVYIDTVNGLHHILMEEIADPRIHGEITLNKSGLDSTSVAGFTLYNSVGAGVSSEQRITGNGTITWPGLPWDTYMIIETTTPAGYSPMANIGGIVVGPTTLTYSFDRVNIKNLGSITLNKTGLDASDTAGFTLYDSTNAPVGAEKTVTGNGSVTWSNLPWDTYKIVEITTPAGYTPITDITGIVVGSTQQVYSFDRLNTKKPGDITLNKSGLGSSDTAGFTLYDLVGNPIGSEKTITGNGTITWSGLPWNTYKIVETTTPAGYTPMADIGGIVIGPTTLTYSFDRVNTPIVQPSSPGPTPIINVAAITSPGTIQVLAFTGLDPIIPISGGSAVIGGLAMILATLRRRVNKK